MTYISPSTRLRHSSLHALKRLNQALRACSVDLHIDLLGAHDVAAWERGNFVVACASASTLLDDDKRSCSLELDVARRGQNAARKSFDWRRPQK